MVSTRAVGGEGALNGCKDAREASLFLRASGTSNTELQSPESPGSGV